MRLNFNALLGCGGGLLLLANLAFAETPEARTARYLESVRKQPPLLLAFLREMPKGGDLHNHLEGSVYAEDAVDWAAESGLCIERTSSRAIAPPCDPCETHTPKPAARCGTKRVRNMTRVRASAAAPPLCATATAIGQLNSTVEMPVTACRARRPSSHHARRAALL